MFMMLMTIMMASMISIIMMMMCTVISKSSKKDKEKLSPFECGFDPMSSARTPFSIQFFLIAVLFLIFDIEIAILLPIIMTMKLSLSKTWIFTMTSFILVLIMGLYHEWNNGVLEWAK
uniref:NADH dehydrogenase subunit 3 n=1 Tax=Piezodorus guildinii TaxID=437484 RepID=UPI00204C4715|nr:NADH dehydrogenase subunit 3 [Piezodorus guildinii]WGT93134.1 NADH dehydrogenase subunit 3 [Piezodorus guildinii]DAZ87553.1 TPA_asm: NADH dehydrogenase subunit 3 [Piezodorus guildinii]